MGGERGRERQRDKVEGIVEELAVKTGMEQASMTNVSKLLGGGLAAVLGVLLLTVSGGFSASTAEAESPPNPAARFAGSVLVDGVAPTVGTTIEARIGSTTCGVTQTFNTSESRYVLDSPALDPGANPNCGTDGAVVTFFVGGKKANESGSWRNYDINVVNLTVTTAVASPSASASPGGSPTTKPPTTGSGYSDESGTAVWLFAALGLGVLAFGAGGIAAARRAR
jgi:hypothetical protein